MRTSNKSTMVICGSVLGLALLGLSIKSSSLSAQEPAEPKPRMTLGAGHPGAVSLAVYSPDGKILATVGWDQPYEVSRPSFATIIKLWDVESGKWVADLKGHTKNVRSLAFNPDSAVLASGGDDKTVRMWDVKAKKEIATLNGHTAEVLSVAFSTDGKTVASASRDKTVRLWDAATGKGVASLEQHTASVQGVAFSPDGKSLASAGWDNSVILWDVKTRKATKTLQRKTACFFNCLAFNPDGTLLATGTLEYNKRKPGMTDDPAEVVLWKLETGEEVAVIEGHKGTLGSVAFSPDGKLLASAGSTGVKVRNLLTRKDDEVLKPKDVGGFATFSPDGKTLVSRITGLRFFDVRSGEVKAPLQDCTSPIKGVAFSRDGKTLAAIDGDLVKLWDVSTGQMSGFLAPDHDAVLVSIAFSYTKDLLATAGGHVKLWDTKTGKEVGLLKPIAGVVTRAAFSPDDELLATVASFGGKVQVWDRLTKVALYDIENPGKTGTALAFSPKGRVVATGWAGGQGGEITLHDVKAKTELATIKGLKKGVTSIAFSPDGKTVASATDDPTVKLWDVSTGKEAQTLKSGDGSVYSLTFSPDGAVLAGVGDKTVCLWDVASGKVIAVLRGHTGGIVPVEFSPDGKTMVSGSWDGTIRLWDVPALKRGEK